MDRKIFLTSNTYFGRYKALNIPNRSKFSNIEEMNDFIITQWNKVVTNDDLVYHLGYFAHDPITTSSVLEKLNGNIYFFNNNTDKSVSELIETFDYIMLYEGQIFEIPEKQSILSYYPLLDWNNRKNIFHFYGYDKIETDLKQRSNMMNVSFDLWNRPVLIDECIDFIKTYNKL